jgi:hypothetical protein
MKYLQLKGGQNYFITDDEAIKIAEKIESKGVAFLKRLGGVMVSEFTIVGLGPVNEDCIGKDIFADANGVFYYNDGQGWYFYHYTGKPFNKNVNGVVLNFFEESNVDYEWETDKDYKNRTWKRVNDYHEIAVIPVEKYLTLQFSNDIKLLGQSSSNSNLPSVMFEDVRVIGIDKRLAREEDCRKRHKDMVEWFKALTILEKDKYFDSFIIKKQYAEGSKERNVYDEFVDEFMALMPTQEEIKKATEEKWQLEEDRIRKDREYFEREQEKRLRDVF